MFNPDFITMKKLVLSATLLLSVATFAQKDELKTLKKIYSKNAITEKDLENYKLASDALQTLASEESDKVYAKFYKVMYPTVVLASKGSKATMQDQMSLFTQDFIKSYGEIINEVIAFEKKSGKKIYTDELVEEKTEIKNTISTLATNLNNSKKYKEASDLFYVLYVFDPETEGRSLFSSAQLAINAQDYLLAEKLYEEFYKSDYFNKGMNYYAINKASGVEENMGSKEMRSRFIQMGLYEKPRDEKVSKLKPEVLRTLAVLYSQNNSDLNKLKNIISEARQLNPDDKDLLTIETNYHFLQGYEFVKEDYKLVDEINNSLSNKKKYDELTAKRKDSFVKALPYLEKAYSINPNDTNTKTVLKMTYEVLGQPEKAKAIN